MHHFPALRRHFFKGSLLLHVVTAVLVLRMVSVSPQYSLLLVEGNVCSEPNQQAPACTSCKPQWTGFPHCTYPATCRLDYCGGSSRAKSVSGTIGSCSCVCQDAYSGTTCNQCGFGYDGTYPSCYRRCTAALDCSNKALAVSGNLGSGCSCTCLTGFDGSSCEKCAVNYAGHPNCQPAPCENSYCNNHGTAVGNKVSGCSCPSCSAGFTGTTCNGCASDYESYPNCYRVCTVAIDCSGRATGVSGNVNSGCSCTCQTGYTGASCNTCAAGYGGSPCAPLACASNHCNNNGVIAGNQVTGCSCSSCSTGFTGATCNACAIGYESYPNCYRICTNAVDCNGHASAVSGNANSGCSCDCQERYNGATCNSCAVGFQSGYPSCYRECTNVLDCNSKATSVAGNVGAMGTGCSCTCSSRYGGASCNRCADGLLRYPVCETPTVTITDPTESRGSETARSPSQSLTKVVTATESSSHMTPSQFSPTRSRHWKDYSLRSLTKESDSQSALSGTKTSARSPTATMSHSYNYQLSETQTSTATTTQPSSSTSYSASEGSKSKSQISVSRSKSASLQAANLFVAMDDSKKNIKNEAPPTLLGGLQVDPQVEVELDSVILLDPKIDPEVWLLQRDKEEGRGISSSSSFSKLQVNLKGTDFDPYVLSLLNPSPHSSFPPSSTSPAVVESSTAPSGTDSLSRRSSSAESSEEPGVSTTSAPPRPGGWAPPGYVPPGRDHNGDQIDVGPQTREKTITTEEEGIEGDGGARDHHGGFVRTTEEGSSDGEEEEGETPIKGENQIVPGLDARQFALQGESDSASAPSIDSGLVDIRIEVTRCFSFGADSYPVLHQYLTGGVSPEATTTVEPFPTVTSTESSSRLGQFRAFLNRTVPMNEATIDFYFEPHIVVLQSNNNDNRTQVDVMRETREWIALPPLIPVALKVFSECLRTRVSTPPLKLVFAKPSYVPTPVTARSKAQNIVDIAQLSTIGAGGVALQMARSTIILSLVECKPDWDSQLGRMQNPFQVSLEPSEQWGQYLAASVLNNALIFGFVFLHLSLAAGYYLVLKRRKAQRGKEEKQEEEVSLFKAALVWARFPSVSILPVMYLIEPTAMASLVVMLFAESSTMIRVLGGGGMLGLVCMLFLSLPAYLRRAWGARMIPGKRPRRLRLRQLRKDAALDDGFGNIRSAGEQNSDFSSHQERLAEHNSTSSMLKQWISYFIDGGVHWRDQEGRKGFCRGNRLLFMDYSGKWYWFLTIELALAAVIGMLDALKFLGHCEWIIAALVFLLLVFLILIVAIQPYNAPFLALFSILATGVQLLASICILVATIVGSSKEKDWWTDQAEKLALFSIYLVIGRGIFDLAPKLQQLFRMIFKWFQSAGRSVVSPHANDIQNKELNRHLLETLARSGVDGQELEQLQQNTNIGNAFDDELDNNSINMLLPEVEVEVDDEACALDEPSQQQQQHWVRYESTGSDDLMLLNSRVDQAISSSLHHNKRQTSSSLAGTIFSDLLLDSSGRGGGPSTSLLILAGSGGGSDTVPPLPSSPPPPLPCRVVVGGANGATNREERNQEEERGDARREEGSLLSSPILTSLPSSPLVSSASSQPSSSSDDGDILFNSRAMELL